MKQPLVHQVNGLSVSISGPNGSPPRSTFDFGDLGFSDALSMGLMRAFIALNGGSSIEMQRYVWRHVVFFAGALKAYDAPIETIPATCLEVLYRHLKKTTFAITTRVAINNSNLRILRWCQRNSPELLDPKIKLFAAAEGSQKKILQERKSLDESLLKQILAACYADIEVIEERIARYRQLPLTNEPSIAADTLLELLMVGNGCIPSQRELLRSSGGNQLNQRLAVWGGLNGIVSQYCLTAADIFPFYLAILVQTSGNPQSLLRAHRDCVLPHPIRSDLERVVWDKMRAGREQAPDFPKSKTWSAPNIVRKLLGFTNELVPHASELRKNDLFLCRNLKNGISTPSWQAIHNQFKHFRAKHNLPRFDLRDLRRAGAKLHHKAGRSIVAAQQRLNHASSDTTQIYTPLKDRSPAHDSTILRFQGLLVKEAELSTSVRPKVAQARSDISSAQTVFGFGCKDPLSGTALGSKAGEHCLQFHKCATCPGAIVVVDDPLVVSRIVGAREALVAAQERSFREGWSARFQAHYGPVLAIIEKDLLPAVSDGVLQRAKTLSAQPITHLE